MQAPELTVPGSPTAIAGHVRDRQGQAIAGARVCAQRGGGRALAAAWVPNCGLSGSDGSYRLEGLLPGRYAVDASARGFIPGHHGAMKGPGSQVAVTPGAEVRGIDMVLWPGGVALRGTVHDASGGEIEGAIVSAGGSTDFSGADGSFVLHVRPGKHGVKALAEGYAPGGAWAHAPGQAAQVLLLPEAVLVGQVVRADDGLPVSGATVVLKRSPQVAVTDASGNFRMGQLRPGIFKPRVDADAYMGMAEGQVHIGIGETSSPVIIRVHPATTVRGKIVGPGGASCEEGTVSLTEPTTRRGARGEVEADGEVAIRGLLPGIYAVSVHCEGSVPEDIYEDLAVGEAPIDGVTWKVGAGRAIHGKVVDAGGAAALVEGVVAQPEAARAGGFAPKPVPTGPDGSFTLAGLAPGRYSLEVMPGPGRPQPPRQAVEVPADGDLEGVVITLPDGGEVRGRVIDGEGRPVARANVRLRGEQDGGSQESGDDGRFALQGVPPGRYRATASIDFTPLKGQGPGELPGVSVDVRVGAPTELEIVVEGRGGRITGQVVDGSGEPIADAMLDWVREADAGGSAFSRSFLTAPRQPTLSDGDGRFEIPGLSPGSYAITASRRGASGEGRVEHVAVDSATVVTIPDSGEIGGSVRIAGGGTPEWVKVTAHGDNHGGWGADEFFRTDGRFTLAGLGPGTYTVRAESGEGGAETTVTLAEGEVRRDIELVLAARVTVRGRLVDLDTGAPVVGMHVSVHPNHGGLDSYRPDRRQLTDAQGRFEVEGAATGPSRVQVSPGNQDYQGGDYPATAIFVLVEGTGTVELPPIEVARRRAPGDRPPADLGFTLAPAAAGQDPAVAPAIIANVRPDGPAGQAGIRAGDEIVAVDGHVVTGPRRHLFRALTTVPDGTTLQLTLGRGETIAVTAESLN